MVPEFGPVFFIAQDVESAFETRARESVSIGVREASQGEENRDDDDSPDEG